MVRWSNMPGLLEVDGGRLRPRAGGRLAVSCSGEDLPRLGIAAARIRAGSAAPAAGRHAVRLLERADEVAQVVEADGVAGVGHAAAGFEPRGGALETHAPEVPVRRQADEM